MKIEAVDFFYLSMPEVLDIGDGSQDALLVRVRGRRRTSAGASARRRRWCRSPAWSARCRTAPASRCATRCLARRSTTSHDIRRIGDLVRANSLDLLQADHTLSGIDMALWDLLGRRDGRAGLQAARLRRRLPQDAVRVAALRRHAAGDPGQGRAGGAAGLPGGEVRLGAVRARARRGRRRRRFGRPVRGWARTGSCWSTPGPSGSTTSTPRPARCRRCEAVRRDLARRAVRLRRARAYRQLAQPRRRRSSSPAARAATTPHGPST